MKKIALLLIFIVFMSFKASSQQFQRPSEGKSLVYFVRYSNAVAIVDFRYFDGEKYLGKVSGYNYYTYECDPGEHVFWITAENREYIKGNLKPNATYVIEVRPFARIIMSGVELYQISPDDKKAVKQATKLITRNRSAEMKGLNEDLSSFIKSGLERYNKIESKVTLMNPDWTF